MKVAILGSGASAFALAVLLIRDGHEPVIWSPSGRSAAGIADGRPVTATGIIEGDFHVPVSADCADAISSADAVIFALPAMGHRQAMTSAAPHLDSGQTVIISAHTSFGALYLDSLLAARGITLPIVAWSTTLLRARQPTLTSCRIATLRQKVDIAVLPTRLMDSGLECCRRLFGDRFNMRSDLLAVSLSNVNAQGHMALGLCNFTRMELGESWDQNECSTPSVEILLSRLDDERIKLASKLGVVVRTSEEHAQQTHGSGGKAATAVKTLGPATIQTRYTLEDVPYGLVPIVRLAELAGVDVPLHAAGIRIFSALYGRDFTQENDLLGEAISSSIAEFRSMCSEGAARQVLSN